MVEEWFWLEVAMKITSSIPDTWMLFGFTMPAFSEGLKPHGFQGTDGLRSRRAAIEVSSLVVRYCKRLHSHGQIHNCSWENSLISSMAMFNSER